MKAYETPIVEVLGLASRENIASFGEPTLDFGQTLSRDITP